MSLQTWKEPWKEALVHLSGSYSSSSRSNSGSWGWDLASHQCLSPLPAPEAVHFLCGEATLRKVKVSMGKTVDLGSHHSRALFSSCSSVCGRAVERCSGMEKHTHLVHLRCGGTGGLARVGSGLTTLFLAGDRQSQSRMKGRRTLLHGAGCWRGHAG